ncbi:TetR/AcrR family transcriptional regulator [Rhodococcus sp. NPDC056743]|uniref:TetR/AcrR family transcriptional regulator n=1 Tax=Rhodococcus sp. NPDC056743 TaxID=3345934 RepID=UPI00366C1A81
MIERAPDPRSLRTVANLRHALRVSLREHPLDDISVSELCRHADVRRTTFYTHYPSVADLLTEMLTTDIDRLLDVPGTTGKSVAQLAQDFQETLVAAFRLVTDERHNFRVGFDSDASAPLRRSLTAMFARRVDIALGIWHAQGAALDTDPVAAAAFVSGGLTASVEAWAASDETDAECWANSVRDQMPPWWPRD